MNPDMLASALQARTAALRQPPLAISTQVLERHAKTVAGNVRQLAARSQHRVAIRVVTKGNGVRITVAGPQAGRYKGVVESELERLLPGAKAEIRAQITRKAR